MIGKTGQRGLVAGVVATGQRDPELPADGDRIIGKRLVKITDTEQQKRAGMLSLYLLVLAHQGRRFLSAGCGVRFCHADLLFYSLEK